MAEPTIGQPGGRSAKAGRCTTSSQRVLLVLGTLAVMVVVLLSGPTGFSRKPQSAEATFLSEVKKLLASDAQVLAARLTA